MLQKSGINLLNKNSYEVRPNDFYNLDGCILEYEGLLSKYQAKEQSYISDMVEA